MRSSKAGGVTGSGEVMKSPKESICDGTNSCPGKTTNSILVAWSLLRNYVPIKIFNKELFAMIDTGADICVANEEILRKFDFKKDFCPVKDSDKQFIVTANSQREPIRKMIIVDVEIAGCIVKMKFYLLPNLMTDFILGLDFLHANNVSIQFGKGEISIDPRRTLSINSDMTIPSKTETVLKACIQGSHLPQGVLGISSGSVGSPEGLVIGNALCHIKEGKTFVRVANFTDKDITLRKGDAIGKFCCLARDDSLVQLPEAQINPDSRKTSPALTTPPKLSLGENLTESQ